MGKSNVVFRTQYNMDLDENSNKYGAVDCELEGGPSLTVQSDAKDADINVIVARFGISGTMPENIRIPRFEDFGEQVFDYRSAVEAISMAADSFMSMPANVRSKFENDPQKFMEFCHDPANADEMVKLGLRVPAPAKEPIAVKVIADKVEEKKS